MNKVIIAVLTCCGLVGCMSTGPIPLGENLYTISKTSVACGFRDAGGVKADLSKEMATFCEEKSLYPEITSIEALDGVIGVRCASSTIEFRCVTSTGTSIYAPTGEKPNRDMNRNPSIATNQGQFGKDPNTPLKIEKSIVISTYENRYAQLRELKALLDSGVITKSEFEQEKKEILAQ